MDYQEEIERLGRVRDGIIITLILFFSAAAFVSVIAEEYLGAMGYMTSIILIDLYRRADNMADKWRKEYMEERSKK